MTTSKHLLTLFFLLFTAATLSAQVDHYCGTTDANPWLIKYKNGGIPVPPKSDEIRYVPLNVVFLGDDEDDNYPEPVQFFNSLRLLNSDYADQNIQFFVFDKINYVANSDYNNFDPNDRNPLTGRSFGDEMARELNVRNLMNTYVIEDASGLCGYNDRVNDAIVLSRTCLRAGDHTWAHEVGHMLGLNHTFSGWEGISIDAWDYDEPVPERRLGVKAELVDGSNCETAADMFCDTPPDYLADRWQCNSRGVFPDTLTDTNGARFAVPAQNIMSYANDACLTTFSEEQKLAMFSNIDGRINQGQYIHDQLPPNALPDVADLAYISPEDREAVPFDDLVDFSWSSVPNADFYIFELNRTPNFSGGIQYRRIYTETSIRLTSENTTLDRSSSYYWRVRAVNSFDPTGEFGPVFRFRPGSTTATINAELDAALVISPNPVRAGQTLDIRVRDLPQSDRISYDLTDVAGRVLVARADVSNRGSALAETINTTGFASGIYFFRLRLGDRFTTRRVVIGN